MFTARSPMLFACAIIAAVPLARAAGAPQIPPQEEGPQIVTTRLVDGKIEMRDAQSGVPLIMPRDIALHRPKPNSDSMIPTIELRTQPAGFDLVYRYHNNGNGPKRLGAMAIGVITLGDRVTYLDMEHDTKPMQADVRRPNDYKPRVYPRHLYSPVSVVYNSNYAIGVSFHYPVLEYKHDVRFELYSPGGSSSIGEGGRGWCVDVRAQTMGGEHPMDYITHEAKLVPGESRTYVISVRVAKNTDEWMRTLLPYRNYFRALYGMPRYERDPRPIQGVTVAGTWVLSQSNPYGFVRDDRRPDRLGWRPWADALAARSGDWRRIMIWAPSGVFRNNPELNFPFKFTSFWMEGASHNHNMGDAVTQLRRVPASGIDLGLWWGRSAQVMRQWEASSAEAFDPDNPDHVSRGFAELDIAVQSGATMIGLDAFAHGFSPNWKLYRWMQMMYDRHPNVPLKFCTEGRSVDFMHAMAPTWMEFYEWPGANPTVNTMRLVTTPFYLADFLNPGHETWAGLAFNRMEVALRRPVTPAEIRAEIEHAAEMGYVPVIFDERPVEASLVAAESWTETVPADLQPGAIASNSDDGGPAEDRGDSQQRRPAGPLRRGYTIIDGGKIYLTFSRRAFFVPSGARSFRQFVPLTMEEAQERVANSDYVDERRR